MNDDDGYFDWSEYTGVVVKAMDDWSKVAKEVSYIMKGFVGNSEFSGDIEEMRRAEDGSR